MREAGSRTPSRRAPLEIASRSVRSSAARSVSPARRSSVHHLASSIPMAVDLFIEPRRWHRFDVRPPTIVELRQYRLVPGKRDVLIDLFEANLVEPQEAAGMTVIGTFRDLDDPSKFVWLRGFPTMGERARSLAAFYGGPVWRRHRDAANTTMHDSENVLLLRPARAESGFAVDGGANAGGDTGIVEAAVLNL